MRLVEPIRSKFRNFYFLLRASTAVEIVQVIALPILAGLSTGLLAAAAANMLAFSVVWATLLQTVASITGFAAAVLAHEFFMLGDHEFEYESIEIQLYYDDIEKMEYTRTKTLVAKKNNRTKLKDRYRWTGDPEDFPKCVNARQKIIDRGNETIWRSYEVIFPRPLSKGEHETVGVKWELTDIQGQMEKFISCNIDRPTGSLTLKLNASRIKEKIESVHVRETNLLGADQTIKAVTVDDRSDGEYIFTISRPRLNRSFDMRWKMVE